MDDKLPEEVDVVVIGTGLPESILAAACSRSGLSVLHLDRNDYYGGEWSSFNMTSIEDWLEKKQKMEEKEDFGSFLGPEETFIKFGDRNVIKNVEAKWTEEISSEELEELKKSFRRFSIDLLPKALLSRGEMVKTLCDSQVSMYAEFKLIDRQLCPTEDGQLNQVPCSKGEIFTSQVLTMMEKRMLMKFINFCTKWSSGVEEVKQFYEEFENKPFSEFLEALGIVGQLQSYIIDAIAILQPQPLTSNGLSAVCKFMDSVGHFGPSPFLYPLYGCGELAQCFCRLSAVFGSTYCLGRAVQGAVSDGQKVTSVIADGQKIACKTLFISSRYLPDEVAAATSSPVIRRVTYVTKKSLKVEEKERVTLTNVASLRPDAKISRIIEAGYEVCLAPKGYLLLHATGTTDGAETIDSVVEKLMAEKEVVPLWKMSFDVDGIEATGDCIGSNVHLCPPVDATIDYANLINDCKSIFCSIWPDRDFLPRSIAKEEEEEGNDKE